MSFLCVGTLWVSILIGFMDTWKYWWLCDFVNLFGTWDYLLSAVGVGHLGPTRSGGSAFSLLPFEIHPRTPWLELLLLAFIFTSFMYHFWRMDALVMYIPFLWWISLFYDDWMYQILWIVLFTLLHLYHDGWCMPLSFMCYSWAFHTLRLVQRMIEHSGFNVP